MLARVSGVVGGSALFSLSASLIRSLGDRRPGLLLFRLVAGIGTTVILLVLLGILGLG